MSELDRRLNAYRPDLADNRLMSRVKATEFTAGEPYTVKAPVADMRAEPDLSEGLVSQALFGEHVTVFEIKNGWAWGQLATDDYVGYFRDYELAPGRREPTHWVSERATFVYSQTDIKTVPQFALSYGSRVSVNDAREEFAVLESGGFIYAAHLTPLFERAEDMLAELLKFVSAPYLWGGRSSFGLDCSSLMQLVLKATGIDCPADSDMQAGHAGLGSEMMEVDLGGMQGRDMVFWKGHVGMMLDEVRFIHSNGYHMKVVVEPLQQAIKRIDRLYARPIGFRRLGP